jgi:hypothetical protein
VLGGIAGDPPPKLLPLALGRLGAVRAVFAGAEGRLVPGGRLVPAE